MKDTERDLLVFSGAIEQDNCEVLIRDVLGHKNRRKKAVLFLCTYGGDPHAAYRMARVIRRCYSDLRILVGAECKSAGTLIALSADSLGFSDFGELGPLDTQMSKPDEVGQRASGLEVFSTLQYLTDHAFACFEQNMLTIIRRSGQNISTRLASEIASRLATGLIKPITAQLDPYRIGVAQRGLAVTKVYGRQLANAKNLHNDAEWTVNHLVTHYPTHAFVIDREEAATLFTNVDSFSSGEEMMFDLIGDSLLTPADPPIILNFASLAEEHGSEQEQLHGDDGAKEGLDRNTTASSEGEPASSAPRRKPAGRHTPKSDQGNGEQDSKFNLA